MSGRRRNAIHDAGDVGSRRPGFEGAHEAERNELRVLRAGHVDGSVRRQRQDDHEIGTHQVEDEGCDEKRLPCGDAAVAPVLVDGIGQREQGGKQRKQQHRCLHVAYIGSHARSHLAVFVAASVPPAAARFTPLRSSRCRAGRATGGHEGTKHSALHERPQATCRGGSGASSARRRNAKPGQVAHEGTGAERAGAPIGTTRCAARLPGLSWQPCGSARAPPGTRAPPRSAQAPLRRPPAQKPGSPHR